MVKFLLKNTVVMKMIKQTLKDNNEGYILFENGDEWKKLFFNNRYLTGSSSSNKTDGTVHYLISNDIINDSLIETSLRTGLDKDKIIHSSVKSTHNETLKRMVIEKITDTIFITSRWENCEYSVVKGDQDEIKEQEIATEATVSEISRELKKSIRNFEKILDSIPRLGSRLKIDQKAITSQKLNSFDNLIADQISSGKTIPEILSTLATHNYFIFKSIYKLYDAGIVTRGIGAPLSKEEIITLVSESGKCEKCSSDATSEVTINALLKQNNQIGNKCREIISVFCELHNEDPENPLYSHFFSRAVSCYIIDFYKNRLSPFAIIKIIEDINTLSSANEFDLLIYEIIKNESGKDSLRNVIKTMTYENEIDVLVSIDKLMTGGIIMPVVPETFIDAVKLGRTEHFESLLRVKEIDNLFSADISTNLSPYMLSVISGANCEKIAEEIKSNANYSRGKPVLHDYEMTYVMLASMTGNYEAAEYLLKNGANPDLHNGNGVTALMLALQNGHDDLAFLLMDYGVDVNAKNGNGYSALMIAASKGMPHIVDNMIKHGADVNFLNSSKQSALNSAVRFGHKDVVISLVAAGADINIRDIDGHTPLYYAESPEITELLQKGSRNSKLIKKELDKKRQNIVDYKRNILKDEKEVVPGSLSVFLFSTLFIVTSLINIHLLISSGDRYGLSSESQKVMDQLGTEYCNKFKTCRKNVPKHVSEKCVEMGTEVMSEYFRFAKKCDKTLVEECKNCITSISCDDFYNITGKNLSEYCYQCISVCKYQM